MDMDTDYEMDDYYWDGPVHGGIGDMHMQGVRDMYRTLGDGGSMKRAHVAQGRDIHANGGR